MVIFYLLTNMSSPHDLCPVGTNFFFAIFFLVYEQFKPLWRGNYFSHRRTGQAQYLTQSRFDWRGRARALDAGEAVLIDAEDLVLLDAGEPILLDAEEEHCSFLFEFREWLDLRQYFTGKYNAFYCRLLHKFNYQIYWAKIGVWRR